MKYQDLGEIGKYLYMNAGKIGITKAAELEEEIIRLRTAARFVHEDWIECSRCGGSVGESGRFCKNCGAAFEVEL